jgi:iron(III) transport system substrate-binding protein
MPLAKGLYRAIAFATVLLSSAAPAFAQTPVKDGFDQRFASLIAEAKKEGELTWYQASLESAGREFAMHFQNRFGIKVNHSFAVGSPALERFRAESRSGNNIADIFNVTDGTLMLQAMDEHLIADHKTSSHDAFPAKWILQANGGIAYPTARVQMAIAYNTEAVKPDEVKLLADWNGLLSPAFANGRLSLADATRVGSVYPMYYMMLRAYPQQFGVPFLQKLAAQKPIIYGGMTEQSGRVAAGETDTGIMVDVVAIQQFNKGAPIAFAYPNPTPVTLQYTAVSAKAPHPNAARLFLEYITSEEGMKTWAQMWGAGTGRPDVDKAVQQKYTSAPWYAPANELYTFEDWAAAQKEYQPVVLEWTKVFRP